MKLTDKDKNAILTILNPLQGLKPWNVKLGIGTFITLDFGEPQEKYGHIYGEWYLWVYGCFWRLETHETTLATAEDSRETMETQIKHMENRTLIGISVSATLDTTLEFEDGLFLKLLPDTEFLDDPEYWGLWYWLLFTPNGKILQVYPGSHWSYEEDK
jgi:hypothetical protein